MSKSSLDVSDGRQREWCETIERFNGLCVVATRFVWQTKSACVGWVCNVGSLELYSIENGSLTGMQYLFGTLDIIAHPFAGALGPESILMVDNNQLRRARGVRGLLGHE